MNSDERTVADVMDRLAGVYRPKIGDKVRVRGTTNDKGRTGTITGLIDPPVWFHQDCLVLFDKSYRLQIGQEYNSNDLELIFKIKE